MVMKFYMCEFKHIRSRKILYKFGLTKHMDVMKRYSKEISESYGNSPTQYNDFKIRVLASYVCPSNSFANHLEKDFLNLFPKGGLVVEDYFDENPGRYDKMSGVTELRELTPFQKRRALKMIYDLIHDDPQQLKMKEKKRQEYKNG